ncbi:MAG: hypothetical protein HJJLKODD_01051 [Phycisphaerae bacterium]|nr:hypothetical protein [Phycisphaerae bacterium]
MAVKVDRLDFSDSIQRAAWSEYVAAHPQATLHHELAWADAIGDVYAHQPFYYIARRGRDVVGVLPLFEIRSLLAGRMLVSVPYGVYGGPLFEDEEAGEALRQAMLTLAAERRVRCVDIRSAEAKWPGLTNIDRYAAFHKALPEKVDEVLGSYPRKSRAEVRHARDQHHLDVRFDSSQLPLIWKLYSQSMRRLGSPNFPRKLFAAFVQRFPQQQLCSVIYRAGQPVAGLLSFIFRDTVLPFYSGCDEVPAAQTGANNYLYFTLMEEAVRRGLRRFDFGRTRIDNAGSFHFKKNQGFEPTPLGYQMYIPAGGELPNLTPSNRKFHFAQAIWKKLPLSLTRPLGSWLSASIPG